VDPKFESATCCAVKTSCMSLYLTNPPEPCPVCDITLTADSLTFFSTEVIEELTSIGSVLKSCVVIVVAGVAIPIYVTDSYASIKTILDGIDCNDLCSDS